VASDGGIFSFGDARFLGSAAAPSNPTATSAARADDPIVAMVPTADGTGYWQVRAAGAVAPFGTATRFGDSPSLNRRVVGAAAYPSATSGSSSPTGSLPGGTPTIAPSGPAPAASAKSRPNILFVILDDMREEGVMNVPEALPKTKQWLQAPGTTFTQGFVTTSLCCPERATVWSGRYAHNHGVFDNHLGDNLDRDWIVPRYLQDAGYTTSLVGKFITDWKFRYEPPHFDAYAAFQGGYTNTPFWVKNPGDTAHHDEKAAFSTDWIGAKAAEFIDDFEAHDDKPWFMQVSPHAPHDEEVEAGSTSGSCDLHALYSWPARHDNVPVPPWNPTPAVTVEAGPDFKAEKADKVPYLRDKKYSKACAAVLHEGHMRTLLAVDDMVDTVMRKLEADGELANTLVIFTTDNGYSWGERGVPSKALPYTEHVKAPFLVRWDGVFPSGGVDDRLVGGEDFLPTYLDAARYSPPELHYPLDGRSFLPGQPGKPVKLLEFGPVGRPSPGRYEGHRNIPTWASLRTGGWQYIEYYGADNTTVTWKEYYDLTRDPWELDNLLVTDPSRAPDAATLSAELRQDLTCAGTSGANACP
jgi:arylsulfatase A-like enzyme